MSKLIKIYGERNTNTNYLSQLIRLNLEIKEIPGVVPPYVMALQRIFPGNEWIRDIYFYCTYHANLGWKHTCVKSAETLRKYAVVRNHDLVIVTITKNPYSWLLSLYRSPYHQYYVEKPNFETFLTSPWETVGRDNTKRILKTPIELWNIKNSAYLGLIGDNTLNLTTENLLADPKAVIDMISRQFDIARRSDAFFNYDRSTKEEDKDSSYYRDYYLNEKWRADISMDAIAMINKVVDRQLMAYFGYQMLP